LARSTAELLAIETDLSKRGVGLVILSRGGERLDTRNPTSKLMLTILAGGAAVRDGNALQDVPVRIR
jgi:DNA invertase Pin-like site-specific DNA recombinase